MEFIQGRSADGRPAWLLSLAHREWIVVNEAEHARLETDWRRRQQRMLYGVLALMVTGPLAVWALRLDAPATLISLSFQIPWLIKESHAWRVRLIASGERRVGGVRPEPQRSGGRWALVFFALPLAVLLGVLWLRSESLSMGWALGVLLISAGLAWALVGWRERLWRELENSA